MFWRIAAGLALAILAGLLVVLVVLAFDNFFLLLFSGLTLLILAYGGWLAFTGRKGRLAVGVVLVLAGLGLLAVEAALLISEQAGKGLLLAAVILAIIYIGLVGWLRQKFWLKRRRQAEASATKRFTKPVLIINPKSGDGRAVKAEIPRLASQQGIQVVMTQKDDNIQQLAERAVESGADVLGVSGGDGTLGAVAKVALKHNLPLVVLPGGTRCHFARDIGLDPKRITDALAGFHGVERAVDVGVINGRVFLNNASFGVYADIVDRPEYREHKVATTRKVLQQILDGEREAYDLEFQDEDGRRQREAVMIFVGVNPYETISLMEPGRRERLDSGLLQVTVVTKLEDATIRQLLGSMPFKKGQPNNVLQWTAKSLEIKAKTEVMAGVDGESEPFTSPVRISIAPTRLRLVVPPEGVRARPKNIFSGDIVHQLFLAAAGR